MWNYRNASNKCPGRLSNFLIFRVGAYSRGALKREKRLLNFYSFLFIEFCFSLTTGKRQREIRLAVPAKLIFITNNKRFSEVLENELVKQKNKFPTLKLKF